jgi:two-component system chemotaxis response regulator CheY
MPSILIADDAVHIRSVCKVILSEYGYRVLEAGNGLEAVLSFVRYRPDVVVLDVAMPGLDGLGALAQIRRHDPDARVIMLTAQAERNKVLAAIHGGAGDYLLKPFQVRRLLDAVRKLLTQPPYAPRCHNPGSPPSHSESDAKAVYHGFGSDAEDLMKTWRES